MLILLLTFILNFFMCKADVNKYNISHPRLKYVDIETYASRPSTLHHSKVHHFDLCDKSVLQGLHAEVPEETSINGSSSIGATSSPECATRSHVTEKHVSRIRNYELLPLNMLLDIAFIFDDKRMEPTMVIEAWREAIITQDYNLIIICLDSFVDMKIPKWVRHYELYTMKDLGLIFRNMPELYPLADNALKIQIDHPGSIGMMNFAYWISMKRYLYIVDTTDEIQQTSCGPRSDVINTHLINVLTAAYIPSCNISEKNHQHFSKTAMSIGLRLNSKEAIAKGVVLNNSVFTLPNHTWLDVPFKNTMLNRKLIGHALFYMPPYEGYGKDFAKYTHLLSSWFLQKCLGLVEGGIKIGSPYLTSSTTTTTTTTNSNNGGGVGTGQKAPTTNTSTGSRTQTRFQNVENHHIFFDPNNYGKDGADLPDWLLDIYNFTVNIPLNITPSENDFIECDGADAPWTGCAMLRLSREMEWALARKYSWISHLAEHIQAWVRLYIGRHWHFANTFIVSSRSSLRPSTSLVNGQKSNQCAAVTITHNEKKLLPLWLRYHMRHFPPEDIYVFDHLTDDNSTHPSKIPQGVNLLTFEGNPHKMPVRYRSKFVKNFQDYLLRSGYKCVVFGDTDEIIIPDPLYYPGGYKEYLDKFVANESVIIVATTAWELAHISYGNGSKESQEPPLKWEENILKQRHFSYIDGFYNKPLISKVPLTYSPGFHAFEQNFRYVMSDYECDPELIMFHLRSLDIDFCMEREAQKRNMTLDMQPNELREGFAYHWRISQEARDKGELCQYAIGCFLGEFKSGQTQVFDNTGVIPLHEMEERWHDVEL